MWLPWCPLLLDFLSILVFVNISTTICKLSDCWPAGLNYTSNLYQVGVCILIVWLHVTVRYLWGASARFRYLFSQALLIKYCIGYRFKCCINFLAFHLSSYYCLNFTLCLNLVWFRCSILQATVSEWRFIEFVWICFVGVSDGGYNLMVIDPPWENKSVHRRAL